MSDTKPYEKETGDWRPVLRRLDTHLIVVVGLERRYLVQDGPATSVMLSGPPPEDRHWIPMPGQPLHYIVLREEWRNVPGRMAIDGLKAAPTDSITT